MISPPIIKSLILLLSLTVLSSCTTNYYLIRHAERLNDSQDTPLSQAGFDRADDLRDRLQPEGIDSIFATPYQRTQQTVQSLANAIGESITIYGTDTTFQFVKAIKRFRGKDIAIAGHSNTIPEMVLYLTGDTVHIDHDDFDNLFIVELKRSIYGTKIKLTQTTYGAASP